MYVQYTMNTECGVENKLETYVNLSLFLLVTSPWEHGWEIPFLMRYLHVKLHLYLKSSQRK